MLLEHGLGRRLEAVRVDDVARHEALRLGGEQLARLVRIARLRHLGESRGQAVEPVDAELHRLDEALLLLEQRPRRPQILRLLQELLLLLPEAFHVFPQSLEGDARRRQLRVQLLAEIL